jgi:cytidine deaminase
MRKPDAEELLSLARNAARHAYSPYSLFPVGAALLCADGTVITGVNVENRSYGLGCCAERSAVFAAVSQGRREFVALAVCCPKSETPVSPCGACRQVLGEFCPPAMPVYFAGTTARYVTSSVGELLPHDSLHELKRAGEAPAG